MNHNPGSKTHILKLPGGITVTGKLDEECGTWDCEWSPPPPFSRKVISKLLPHYITWRDGILNDWAARTGKRIAVITL